MSRVNNYSKKGKLVEKRDFQTSKMLSKSRRIWNYEKVVLMAW